MGYECIHWSIYEGVYRYKFFPVKWTTLITGQSVIHFNKLKLKELTNRIWEREMTPYYFLCWTYGRMRSNFCWFALAKSVHLADSDNFQTASSTIGYDFKITSDWIGLTARSGCIRVNMFSTQYVLIQTVLNIEHQIYFLFDFKAG